MADRQIGHLTLDESILSIQSIQGVGDFFLVSKLLAELFTQGGDFVLESDLLLAAWAVEIAESNLCCCPSEAQHHLEAVGVEDVPASDAHTRLLSEFAREANAAELALSTAHQNTAGLVGIDGNLDALFVEAGEAFGLTLDAPAGMSTLELHLARLEFSFSLGDLDFNHFVFSLFGVCFFD